MTDDPKRLIDPDANAPQQLRDALSVAREELPSDAQLTAIGVGLGSLLGPGGGGGAGAGGGGGGGGGGGLPTGGSEALSAAGAGMSGKAVLGILLAVGLLAGAGATFVAPQQTDGLDSARRPDPERRAPRAAPPPEVAESTRNVHTETAIAAQTEPQTEAQPARPEVARERAPTTMSTVPRPPQGETPSEPARRSETELLSTAQDALNDNAAQALRTLEIHARQYTAGALSQEREVLAVDALLRLGRRDQALTRAGRFRERWPRSTGIRRINTLLDR